MTKKGLCIKLLLLAGLFAAVGCSHDSISSKSKGTLTFGAITLNDDFSDISVSTTKSGTPVFAVSVIDAEGVTAFSTDDLSTVEDGKIVLPSGIYTVKAWSGDLVSANASFDSGIIYYGEVSGVTIRNATDTPVSIECTIEKILADVEFSSNVADNFTSYGLTATSGPASLTFTEDEPRTGYFPYNETIGYSIMLTDLLGDDHVYNGVIEGLSKRDFVHFTVDVKDRQTKDGLVFELILGTTVNEVTTTISVSLSNSVAKPTLNIRGSDGEESFTVGQGAGIDFFVDIEAEAGIKGIYINYLEGFDTSFPKMVEVLKAGDATLARLGIVSAAAGGDTSATVDLRPFTEMLTAGEGEGSNYRLYIGVHDEAYNYVFKEYNFEVVLSFLNTLAPTADGVLDWSGERGTTGVTFNGSWMLDEEPTDLSFAYREKGTTDWSYIDADRIDPEGKAFSVDMTMFLGKTLEIQAQSSDDAGRIIEFTTARPAEPSNLGFEEWYQSGKTWYPYLQNGVKDWDSGNSGVTSSFAGSGDSITVPEYTLVHSGTTAVKMSTRTAPSVGLAAGNIFTGYFEFNLGQAMSDPTKMVHFGRPYEGRPIQFRGYYIYQGGAINVGSTHQGEADRCNMFISLEKWGSGVTSRPTSPLVVGYGSYNTDASNSSYQLFTCDINYTSTDMPDHVVIVATSSIYGDQYAGCVGSTLYLDSFELVY